MGTLFDQPERNYRTVESSNLTAFLRDASEVAKKLGVTVPDVIAAAHVLEIRRRNDLYVANGDVFDEQVAGLGHLLQEITSALGSRK
jgi:hypothetical protein